MSPPTSRRPNFLILGAQKSGTSSLAGWIQRHPAVFVPPSKELHYFTTRLSMGDDWYREQFRDSGDAVAIGEATPEYLYVEGTPKLVLDTLGPDLQLVAILRNPIDRAYSNYWHGRLAGALPATFEAALDEEDRNLARGRYGWEALVDRGRYLRQIQRWQRHFGEERMHVELFDDLLADPAGVVERVWTFLGVDPADAPGMGYRPRNRARRSRLPHPLNRQLQRLPAGKAKDLVRNHTTVEFSPPPMRPATRLRLRETFQRENEALGRWLGRDLEAWS